MGVIFSFLRIFGCHFKLSPDVWVYFSKKVLQNNFSCLSHARHSCQCLTRLLFSGFICILFGSAAGFIGAIFKAKMVHPRIKKVCQVLYGRNQSNQVEISLYNSILRPV